MNFSEETRIEQIALHAVGNKQNEEPLRLSHDLLRIKETVKETLKTYFLTPFKSNEYFQFHHLSELSLNSTYCHISAIFDDPDSLYDKSLELARHLYEQSTHPKIKSGELYIVYFKNCHLEGELMDAIGIFKAENKDTFLKVYQEGDNFVVESEDGININKLDKGCVIFNTMRDDGYMISVVDNTNKALEAQYWVDDFLQIRQRRNEYYNTENTLSLCKDFVVNKLPEEFEITKSDQVDMLKRSVNFFKANENFDIQEFKQEVIAQPDLIECFDNFKEEYEDEKEVNIADSFAISESAVKKQAKNFKSVIKLDNNFHIYVHGNSQMMKKGKDSETGMSYYQIFFQEESFK